MVPGGEQCGDFFSHQVHGNQRARGEVEVNTAFGCLLLGRCPPTRHHNNHTLPKQRHQLGNGCSNTRGTKRHVTSNTAANILAYKVLSPVDILDLVTDDKLS